MTRGEHRCQFGLPLVVDDDRIKGCRADTVGPCQDITARSGSGEGLRAHADVDPRTGLHNSVSFAGLLAHAIVNARRCERLLAVMFVDLVHVNDCDDALRRAAGDALLREAGRRLTGCVRCCGQSDGGADAPTPVELIVSGCDIVARHGGANFTVLLADINQPEDAAMVARRIAQACSAPFTVAGAGAEIGMSANIGISILGIDGEEAAELLHNASLAARQIPSDAGGGYQFHARTLHSRVTDRFSLQQDLRNALKRNELLLRYQPRIDLAQHRLAGVEAVAYLRRPDGALLPPADFIPLAEETGLIVPLDEWVLFEACGQMARWRDGGLAPPRMSINVSAMHLTDRGIVGRLWDILEHTGVDTASLAFEVTESQLFDDADTKLAILNDLSALGVGISIDDFGSGYTSLRYLRRFPLSALKIDRSLVRDVARDGDHAAIVEAAIALAHSLRLRVAAEGVDSEDQLRFLDSHACDEIQGALISNPLDPDSFASWCQRNQNGWLHQFNQRSS
jgi:EAL domain-containing protein (putative c-di-GMP-specific phosphodiesterase class I)/GGDEF domain-containing protein